MPRSSLLHIVAEEAVEFGIGDAASQAVEFAVFSDIACRADDRGPRNPRERAAQADAAHAESCKILHCQICGGRHQEIYRLLRYRLYHRRDLFTPLDPRRIEAIRAGRGE